MPRPRKSLICETDTPYYHCISRCVRRAFLCGFDRYSGVSYEHRRQWVEDRLHLLADVFAIDVCAYAIMSNHIHIVLHINTDQAKTWSVSEVITRWHRMYKGTILSRQYLNEKLYDASNQISNEVDALVQTVEASAKVWRQRLCDISWFMRALNEPIARQANKEDSCTGRFWEGRFKSQALLDEQALANCMAYVDLNPIRANMADTLEASNHTSIQYRLNAKRVGKSPKRLMKFSDCTTQSNSLTVSSAVLPFTLDDYFAFVAATGNQTNRTPTLL